MPTANPLLLKANTRIRRGRPLERPEWECTIRRHQVVLSARPRRPVTLIFIFFRSSGCRFDRRGECTMCNYGIAEKVSSERIIRIVRKALGESAHYEALGISPFGNMFDPYEVPPAARRRIFELVATTDCTSYSCESRPETIGAPDVAECAAILEGKAVHINLGLESARPWIQANCVGKSLDLLAFRDAAALLGRHGVRPVANTLLGAPFLSEREGIQSTTATLAWALGNGADMCVLFPSNVKRWTLQHWLWERGLYAVPSLWSLVETLHDLGSECAERVSLSWYSVPVSDPVAPAQLSDPVVAVPTTCASCHADVIAQLTRFNATADFEIIEDLRRSTCRCRDCWRRQVDALPRSSLLDRVALSYYRIGEELLDERWWRRHGEAAVARLADQYEAAAPGVAAPGGP